MRQFAIQPVNAPYEFGELAAGQLVEQQRFIRDQADLLFDLERILRHGQSHQPDCPRSGRSQPHQHLDGGGFARAIGTQESEEAALGNGERQPVDSRFGAVDLSEIADFYGGGEVGHCAPSG
jgi:hypothetical protein